MYKRILSYLLILALVCINLPTDVLNAAVSAATMTTVPLDGTANTHRTMGLGYFDTWINSAGQWDTGEPGSTQTIEFAYKVNLNKKIKSIKVTTFQGTNDLIGLWGSTRQDVYEKVEASIPSQLSVNVTNTSGIGTTSVEIQVSMRVKLDAEKPIRYPHSSGNPNIYGLRYYLPLVITVVTEDEPVDLVVKHYKTDGTLLATDAAVTTTIGKTLTAKSKTFTGLQSTYYKVSTNGGKSFGTQQNGESVDVKMIADSFVFFYYALPTKVTPFLNITADPSSLDTGQTSDVKFTLDASSSSSTNGVKNYEFFFGPSESEMKSLGVKTESSITTTVKDVSPDTTWYGKVVVTDTKSNTGTAEDTVDIEEKTKEDGTSKPAEARARISSIEFKESSSDAVGNSEADVQLVDYIDHIDVIDEGDTDNEIDSYVVWIKYDEELIRILEDAQDSFRMHYDLYVDASSSRSTYDIGQYDYMFTSFGHFTTSKTSATPTLTAEDFGDRYQLSITGNDLYWVLQYPDTEEAVQGIEVDVYDSKQPDVTDSSDRLEYEFKFMPEPMKAPEVSLIMDRSHYIIGETGNFTPTFTEHNVKIESYDWEIKSKSTDFIINDDTIIPDSMVLDMPAGGYTATQRIYYTLDGVSTSSEATVSFSVVPLNDPDVLLTTDKTGGILAQTVALNVVYEEGAKYYEISEREWKILDPSGNTLASGTGTIPSLYTFDDILPTGIYIAKQSIYWRKNGKVYSDSSSVTFNFISPVPVADSVISLANGSGTSYFRIDDGIKNGIELREILIDLTSSDAVNVAKGNTIPIVYSSDNTQVQITPLASSGVADLDKNTYIQVPSKFTKAMVDSRITISKSGIVSVRIDSPGVYRVRYRVNNGKYTSNWEYKDITISEDLVPEIKMSFVDVSKDATGQMIVQRDATTLGVKLKVKVESKSKDTDGVSNTSSKLILRYDKNGDNNLTNDNGYSALTIFHYSVPTLNDIKFTRSILNTYNESDSTANKTLSQEFNIDMSQIDNALLGKVQFDYYVQDIPTYAIFNTSGISTAVAKGSNTYSLNELAKTILIQNSKGVIDISFGSKGKVEVTLIKGYDSFTFNYQTLIDYYGDSISIYELNSNGTRTLVY